MKGRQHSANGQVQSGSELRITIKQAPDSQSAQRGSLCASRVPKSLFSDLRAEHVWLEEFGVSSKETEALPEFFDPENVKKNRFIYQKLRNYMIKAYWLKPERKLAFTAVRRVTRGDVGCLLRVFQFLERERVINCRVRKAPVRRTQKRSFMQAFEFPVRRFGDLAEEMQARLGRVKQRIRAFLLRRVSDHLPECGVCEEMVSLRWFSHKQSKGTLIRLSV